MAVALGRRLRPRHRRIAGEFAVPEVHTALADVGAPAPHQAAAFGRLPTAERAAHELALGGGRGGPPVRDPPGMGGSPDQLKDRLPHGARIGSQAGEHPNGCALPFTEQAEEQVLGSDVVVAELVRLPQRQLEHFLHSGRERRRSGGRARVSADQLLDVATGARQCDAELHQGAGRRTLVVGEQPQKDVLGADEIVVEETRLFLSEDEDSSAAVGESFEDGSSLPPARPRVGASVPAGPSAGF